MSSGILSGIIYHKTHRKRPAVKKFIAFLLICLLLLHTGCGAAASYEEVYAKAYADAYKNVYNGKPSEPAA